MYFVCIRVEGMAEKDIFALLERESVSRWVVGVYVRTEV